MPRGRHRHSPPLHKLLPPMAVAGGAVVCAAGAWLFADPAPLRSLVLATAAVAVTGAFFMRRWDRDAGHRVADLTRGRESDQWRTEERVAELEAEAEESRELRAKLEAKLRAKRVELAGLRGEHAALLRRYATAETERASALEGRRRLAIEASSGTAGRRTPTDSAYLLAARALDDLMRNFAIQQVRRTVEAARERDLNERSVEAEEPKGRHAVSAGGAQHNRPSSSLPATRVQAASAIVPYAAQGRQTRRPGTGFDFFGTQSGPQAGRSGQQTGQQAGQQAPRAADRPAADQDDEPAPAAELARAEREDLADVVGEEALAAQRATEGREAGQVIDLTAHDETEPAGTPGLRSAIGS
ncbi:hypothetical protein [Streptomyces sp. NPDC088725]|uniref:hypothetical protein n=1 Tax=Streptomyces sp. NPDC088725 TaxID=3365873 RepID=UPI003818240C